MAREIPLQARQLADAFWPGPLTLILPRAARALDAVTGGQDTVGLRVPLHPVAREVLSQFGGGVAAPSANRFGRVSPTRAEHVREELGSAVDLILEGGDCSVGLESTIIDLSGGPTLLRPGAITREQLQSVLDQPLAEPHAASPRASGRLESHYAPEARLVSATKEERVACAESLARTDSVALLAPPGTVVPPGITLIPLPDEPELFAQGLYAALRAVDLGGCAVAVLSPPEPVGLGLAIWDRLRKASAPRS